MESEKHLRKQQSNSPDQHHKNQAIYLLLHLLLAQTCLFQYQRREKTLSLSFLLQ